MMSFLPATNPVRKCKNLVQSPELLLRASPARTVVDLAVQEDPYFVYKRAVSAFIQSFLCRLTCEKKLL